MGKKITVYLTDEDLSNLKRICEDPDLVRENGNVCLNISRGIKTALQRLTMYVGATALTGPSGKEVLKEVCGTITIVKSPLDLEKEQKEKAIAEKKAKARADAEKYINEAPNLGERVVRGITASFKFPDPSPEPGPGPGPGPGVRNQVHGSKQCVRCSKERA